VSDVVDVCDVIKEFRLGVMQLLLLLLLRRASGWSSCDVVKCDAAVSN